MRKGENMKDTCKTCKHCHPSYKSNVCCKDNRQKKVKLNDSCKDWKEKQ